MGVKFEWESRGYVVCESPNEIENSLLVLDLVFPLDIPPFEQDDKPQDDCHEAGHTAEKEEPGHSNVRRALVFVNES